MDPATLTSIIQAIVTIITTLSGVWAIFNKKNADLEKKLSERMDAIDNQVRQSNAMLARRQDLIYPDKKI